MPYDMAPYEWVAWLSGQDARLLLLWLMSGVENPTCSLEILREIVAGWRANALQALTAEDWRASVDAYLEVGVDARLHVFRTGHDGYRVQEERG